jgi:hypothetical protein
MRNRLAAAGLLCLFASCSGRNDLPPAQTGVSTFHQMLNAGQFDAIYAASGPDMKKASTQADMVALFDAVHRKLGDFQSGVLRGWYVNATTSGPYVTVTYRDKYEHASADETFGWRVSGGHALLSSYFINSTYLIIH